MKSPQFFLLSIHFVELVTAITISLVWNKYKHTTERKFIYFFWIVFFVDTLGTTMAYITKINNQFIYNSLLIFYFVFFTIWYKSVLKNKNQLLAIVLVIYLILLGISFVKEGFTETLQTISYFGTCLAVITYAVSYYFQLLNSEKILGLKTNLPFWITMGNIIYFVGLLPLVLFQKYLNISLLSYSIILTLLNWVTYTCYILGFTWMKNK
ncbi:hypothetical protein [Aquimarina agarivorans]|uniref:hypothetical protein n=1 Tax=Aquimarina agarivorans TaxID=980584 RepID=UPI000248EFF6|nr:hypothetical protein [Aquimarina agarivorans]